MSDFELVKFLKSKFILICALIMLSVLGLLFISYTWEQSMYMMSSHSYATTNSAASMIDKENLSVLTGSEEDIWLSEYIEIKQSLVSLARSNSEISYAYIYKLIGGETVTVADSFLFEVNHGEFTVKGHEGGAYEAFTDKDYTVSGPFKDSKGVWKLSVFVPVSYNDGEVLAVLGIDFEVTQWYNDAIDHAVKSAVIVLCFILIAIGSYELLIRNISIKTEKKKVFQANEILGEKEELFKTIFEQSPFAIAIADTEGKITDINSMFCHITGLDREKIIKLGWNSLVSHGGNPLENHTMPENVNYSAVKKFLRPDGSVVWANMTVSPITDGGGNKMLCLAEDITKRKVAEKKLEQSENSKAVLISNLPGMAYRCLFDRDWTMQFVSEGCYALTGYRPESLLFNKDLTFNDLIHPHYRETLWKIWEDVISNRKKFKQEYEIITATSERKWVLEQGQGIYDSEGKVEAIEGLIIDITDRKKREDEIEYLSHHDSLTGLYNRRHFDSQRERFDDISYLPLSVLIGDINGVKLINDAFGHSEGDKVIIKAAEILSRHSRNRDVLARTGGDEFCMLLPNTDSQSAYKILKEINSDFENLNTPSESEYKINISLGFATRESIEEDLKDIMRFAEEYMYKRKLLEHKSSHSALISSIKATMFERSHETEEHAERLQKFSGEVGRRLGLSQEEIDMLSLLATLHDIGKIGIDDRILYKPDKLTEEEWAQMRKHPEIGYRIAMASPELASIADFILCHHERYDGKGYPQGLKGEQIPLLSRIIAVVDAYDAMTIDRPYRKAMPHEEAVLEIERNSGTQFDPEIAAVFLSCLKDINK